MIIVALPLSRGLTLLFPGGSKKGSIPQHTASRKPDMALRSLLSVALSSVSVKHYKYTMIVSNLLFTF